MTYYLFLYDQLTGSVRAGRRYPARLVSKLTAPGAWEATVDDKPGFYENVSLQFRRDNGEFVTLWDEIFFRTVNVDDKVHFFVEVV